MVRMPSVGTLVPATWPPYCTIMAGPAATASEVPPSGAAMLLLKLIVAVACGCTNTPVGAPPPAGSRAGAVNARWVRAVAWATDATGPARPDEDQCSAPNRSCCEPPPGDRWPASLPRPSTLEMAFRSPAFTWTGATLVGAKTVVSVAAAATPPATSTAAAATPVAAGPFTTGRGKRGTP